MLGVAFLGKTGANKTSQKPYERYMNEALKEACKAHGKEEAPIGAVIVGDGNIIARGHNMKELKNDPTMHAEMIAIKKACKKLNSWRLNGCDMYVTLEPCPMCAGALLQSRIKRLFIGTPDPKAGAAGSIINIVQDERFNHRIDVYFGILEDECAGILKRFFKDLRNT